MVIKTKQKKKFCDANFGLFKKTKITDEAKIIKKNHLRD